MTNVQRDGRVAVRLPRVVTPDVCVERCGRLKNKLGQAIGQSASEALTAFPVQRAVVCDTADRLLCHADTVTVGYIESDITAGGSPDHLRPSLSLPSPSQLIQAAMENGAAEQSVANVFKRG